MDVAKEIGILIRAKYPILYLISWEERRVEKTLREICEPLNRTLHTWSLTQGMKPPVLRTSEPAKPLLLPGELEALALVHEAPDFTVFLLKDFHSYMRDPR